MSGTTGGRQRAMIALVAHGGLVLAVGAVYLGVVVVPHVALGRSGEVGSGFLLPVVATGIVAVLLEPTRRHTDRLAKRVVLGDRAEPYEVLSRLATALQASGAERELAMAEMLARGTGADEATIWANEARGDELRPIDHWSRQGGADEAGEPGSTLALGELLADPGRMVRPVVHQGRTLGAVGVATSRSESLGPAEQRLVGDVAAALSLPLRNRRLIDALHERAADVRASRRRLIEIHDRERRRLERDLHDGAQQHLVAVSVKLGLAASLADRGDNDPLGAAIRELGEIGREAVETMRAVAHGIYPPRLEAKGLRSALRSVDQPDRQRATVGVVVETDERFHRTVEETAYFAVVDIAQRAVSAGATDVAVVVAADAERLRVVARHDAGPDPLDTGTVLDRAEAAGGEVRQTTGGDGARIEIVLPARRRAMT